jgi:hypothetical protein
MKANTQHTPPSSLKRARSMPILKEGNFQAVALRLRKNERNTRGTSHFCKRRIPERGFPEFRYGMDSAENDLTTCGRRTV